MNKVLRETLIGAILGDAHICKTGLNKAFISFEQSSKKADYLNFLHDLVKKEGLPLMDETVRTYLRQDVRYNTQNSSLYFRTQSIEELRPLAYMFLDEAGAKHIPKNIAEELTHRSLAFWIMDDGQQVKRGGVTLCTDSFDLEEVNILKEALKLNFNLDTNIHHKKSKTGSIYERIYIPKADLDEIKPSIIPHFHDSMLYKINAGVGFKQNTEGFESNQESEMEIDLIDT
jgi:hypothetical protein